MSDRPNLVWLRAFEASARLRSITTAAQELGLSQAAVSHQIRSLEASFGVALFTRRARHLELTALEARTITPRAPLCAGWAGSGSDRAGDGF